MSQPYQVNERVSGFRDIWGGEEAGWLLTPYSGVVVGFSRAGLPVVELDDAGGFIELGADLPVVARPLQDGGAAGE